MDQNIRLISAAASYAPPHGGYPGDPFAPIGDEPSASIVGLVNGSEKPFMEQLAEAAIQPLSAPPQFVLVLQDVIDADTGETLIEVAGVQRPEAFDHTSPCHVVGTWIRAHLPQIFEAARNATIAPKQQLRLPDGSVIGARPN